MTCTAWRIAGGALSSRVMRRRPATWLSSLDAPLNESQRQRLLALPDVHSAAVINFLVEPDGDGSADVSTETRVHAPDAAAARLFAAYWRVIYPGSALIRRMWLAAVKRRAEQPSRGK